MKAKEMFEKLGYKRDKRKKYIVYYQLLKLGREKQIEFNFDYKTVEKRQVPSLKCETINMRELKAINKQIKELGWNKNNNENEHGYWSNGIKEPSTHEQYQGIIREYSREVERLTNENNELKQKLYGQTNIYDFIGDDDE